MIKEAAKGWRGKLMLANRLAYPAPGAKPLAEAAPERLEQFLVALEALVPKYKLSGDKVIITDETPERKEDDPEDAQRERYCELFEDMFDEALSAVERLPGNKRARAVLEALVVLLKADEDDKLYENGDDDDHTANLRGGDLKAAANVLAGKKRDEE
jgi:hypothetical protein